MDSQVITFPRVLPALVGVLAVLLWFPGISGAQLEEPVFRALPVDPVPPRYTNEGYPVPQYSNEVYPVAPRAIPVVPSREREGLGLFGRRKDKDRDVERRAPAGGTSDQATVYPLEQDIMRTAPPGAPGSSVPGYGPAAPGMPQDPAYQPRPTQGYVPGQPVPQAPVYPNSNPYPPADPYAPRPTPGAVYPPVGPGMSREVPPVAPVLEAPPATMPPAAPAFPDQRTASFPANPYPSAPGVVAGVQAPPSTVGVQTPPVTVGVQTPPVGPAMPPSDAPIFRRDPVMAPAPAPPMTDTVLAPVPPSLGPDYPSPAAPAPPTIASASTTETMAPIFRSTAPAPAFPQTGGPSGSIGAGVGMAPPAPAAPAPQAPPAPPAPPKAEDEFAHLPFAKPVPGKVGFVLLPDYKGEIDVRGIAPGTPVEIPHPADETKTIQFRVP